MAIQIKLQELQHGPVIMERDGELEAPKIGLVPFQFQYDVELSRGIHLGVQPLTKSDENTAYQEQQRFHAIECVFELYLLLVRRFDGSDT